MTDQGHFDQIRQIGFAYFYDSFDERSIDQTIELIQKHIDGSGDDAISGWEEEIADFEMALASFSDSELDEVLLNSYGYLPSDVGGSSRAFFDSLLAAMSEAIKKRRCR